MKFIRHLKQDSGAGIVEYGLIVALIAIVSLTSVKALGHSTSGSLTTSAQSITHSDNEDGDGTTTTTGAPGTDSTTTTLAGGSGGSDDSGQTGGEGSGGSGGTTTTTTAPVVTTTTMPAPTTTTLVPPTTKPPAEDPDYQTEEAGVKGKVMVTFGYVDGKLTIEGIDAGPEWTMEMSDSDGEMVLVFTNEETGEVIIVTAWVNGGGKLKTKVTVTTPKKGK